jgi:hypothetical protein
MRRRMRKRKDMQKVEGGARVGRRCKSGRRQKVEGDKKWKETKSRRRQKVEGDKK